METKTVILVHRVDALNMSKDRRRNLMNQYNEYIKNVNEDVEKRTGLKIINYVIQGNVSDVKCIYPETLLPDDVKIEEIQNIIKCANDICAGFFLSQKDVIKEIEKWIDYKECPPKCDDVLIIAKGKLKMLGGDEKNSHYTDKIFGIVKNKDLKENKVRGYDSTRDIITEYRYLNYQDRMT